ncbi:cell division protein DedD [Candidatus Nomurabacteria bacterium]|nr:cell division protein DedD [Candidatus Nomurabacteria bacterium]
MSREVEKYLKIKRPSWDEYFLGMANYVGTRGTCSGQSGCVIVRDKRVISTGYVGSPPGLPHCGDVGHDMHTVINEDGFESEHCFRTIHDFPNAVAQAARFGVPIDGATLYAKMVPCYTCAKLVIAAGINRVVALNDYHASKNTKIIFKKAGVKLGILNKSILKYK